MANGAKTFDASPLEDDGSLDLALCMDQSRTCIVQNCVLSFLSIFVRQKRRALQDRLRHVYRPSKSSWMLSDEYERIGS